MALGTPGSPRGCRQVALGNIRWSWGTSGGSGDTEDSMGTSDGIGDTRKLVGISGGTGRCYEAHRDTRWHW